MPARKTALAVTGAAIGAAGDAVRAGAGAISCAWTVDVASADKAAAKIIFFKLNPPIVSETGIFPGPESNTPVFNKNWIREKKQIGQIFIGFTEFDRKHMRPIGPIVAKLLAKGQPAAARSEPVEEPVFRHPEPQRITLQRKSSS